MPKGRVADSASKDVALAALLALRSTLVIATVAVLIRTIRDGTFPAMNLTRFAAVSAPLLAVVFLGLLVWEYWRRRSKRRRALLPYDVK